MTYIRGPHEIRLDQDDLDRLSGELSAITDEDGESKGPWDQEAGELAASVKILVGDPTPEDLEELIGELLLRSYNIRKVRSNGLVDIHEMRHLQAAVNIGNTEDCDPANCKLDTIVLAHLDRDHDGLQDLEFPNGIPKL